MRVLISVVAVLLLFAVFPVVQHAQEAAPAEEPKADDSAVLTALGEKCKDIETLHAVMLGFVKDAKGPEEATKPELKSIVNLWYDGEENFLRTEALDGPWYTTQIINDLGCVVWRTDTRSRRIQKASVMLQPPDPWLPVKGKLPMAAGVPGFMLDGLLGYEGVAATFNVKAVEHEDADVKGAKWFSLTPYDTRPSPRNPYAGANQLLVAVDEETGLLAAWVAQVGDREMKVRVVSVETGIDIDGAIFEVPPAIRKIGLKDPKTGEPVEFPKD